MHSKSSILLIFILFTIFLSTSKAVLNFEDERFYNWEADRFNYTNHPCHRICGENERPKICEYVFVVEQYSSMSKACYDCPFNITDCYRPHCIAADGVQKTLYVVNRQLPGPIIEVCRYDKVVVDVRNEMMSESVTIHWHGFKQRGTPFMDGVPSVTQCPILPNQRFRYEFTASEDGTYFWHSHIGNQRADGLFGALIVHPSFSENVHKSLYDSDSHIMIINDWGHLDGNSEQMRQYHYRTPVRPDSIIINGRGRFQLFQSNRNVAYTPYSTFTVERNSKCRFRVINAGAEDCPIEISIDNHKMQVISLDSKDIEPVEVDTMNIWPGERIDFILNANQAANNYWIRYRGYALCAPTNTTNGTFQAAILNYESVTIQNPRSSIAWDIPRITKQTKVLNPYQRGMEAPQMTQISIPSLSAMDKNDESVTKKVDQQIFITFDQYPLDNYDFHRKGLYGYNQSLPGYRIGTLQLNHISLKLPPFPLLSQWDEIKPNSLCDASNIPKTCNKEHCACTHVIKVKLNSVNELVFVDEGRYATINHPLHLHGHFFRVISTEKLNGNVTIDRIKELDRQGKIVRRLNRAPLKDTIKAPGGGYTIVRFYANNPGYWFFHCHFEQHNNIGMALVFKVGEHRDFPPKPDNFPRCGNF